MSDEKHDEKKYVGNIWGWKYSMYSLYIILFFMVLALARYSYLKITDQYPVQYEEHDLLNNNPYLKDTSRIK